MQEFWSLEYCLSSAGDTKEAPTAETEALLNFPQLHLFLLNEAVGANYRFRISDQLE